MAKNSPQDLKNREFFSNNLNKFMTEKGVRQIDLHNALDIPKSTITGYVKGRSMPTAGNLQKLADYLNVKKSDLDFRFSILNTETQTTDTLKAITDRLEASNKEKAISYLTALLEEQEKEQNKVEEPEESYAVKTVTYLAAGLGFSYDDGDTHTVMVENKPPRHDIASIVNGDSMLPVYENGDVVYLVDKGFSRYDGEVCAVAVNDKTYLKKVYTVPNGLRLVSLNSKYSDIFVDFPPANDTHVKIFSVVGHDKTIG